MKRQKCGLGPDAASSRVRRAAMQRSEAKSLLNGQSQGGGVTYSRHRPNRCPGRGADPGERHGLGAARGVSDDVQSCRTGVGGSGGEEHGHAATLPGGKRSSALIVQRKIRGIRPRHGNAADRKRRVAGISQSYGMAAAGTSYLLACEFHNDRRNRSHGRGAGAGEGHGLRAIHGIVRDVNGALHDSPRHRCEADGNGAVCAGAERRGTIVGHRKVPRCANAADLKRSIPGIAQRETSRQAGGVHVLVTEGKARSGETRDGLGHARSSQAYRLWGQGRVVVYGQNPWACSRQRGSEGHQDRALRAHGQGRHAVIRLRKVTTGGDARYVQGRAAGICQRHLGPRAGGPHILRRKAQVARRRRKRRLVGPRRRTSEHILRVPGSAITYRQHPAGIADAVGEKETLKAQLDPGARVAGQSLATVNAPLTVTPEIASGAPLGLLTVTVAGALVVPGACMPKSSRAG